MQQVDFEETLEQLVQRDPRYPREAYFFVREALDHTHKLAGKAAKVGSNHVSGQQLLEGIRDYAIKQFGPMTNTVLDEWNITRCQDFGEIVFNMVDANLLAKTDKDSREDFKCGYDFEEAFVRPFLPKSKLIRLTKPAENGKHSLS